ncbi:uncharacterized protein [Symphalangus syndactylus]|uniref:uncharacterized protein n=1 Tax=Symphalangus syndactylus TaxID=9590 RepID=UPI003006C497
MVVPTQPARRLQPRKSSFPGDGDEAPGPGGGDGAAAGGGGGGGLGGGGRSAQRRAGAGARRPIGAAPSVGPGGELQGWGRKSGCRPPGPEGWAGGRKLRRWLPPRRFSNFCCRSPCAQTAVRRRRRAPSPRGAGWREGAGAGCRPGDPRNHGGRGVGCRAASPAAEGAAGAASPAGAGGHRGEAEAAARSAAPPGPRTASSRSPRARDWPGLGEGGHGLGIGGAHLLRTEDLNDCEHGSETHGGAALARQGCVPVSGPELRRNTSRALSFIRTMAREEPLTRLSKRRKVNI